MVETQKVVCKICRQNIYFTEQIDACKDKVSCLYDTTKTSRIARELMDSWVGLIYKGLIYCRICTHKRFVVFGTVDIPPTCSLQKYRPRG